jgi:D-alanyl-D-alanine carboxypeptidase
MKNTFVTLLVMTLFCQTAGAQNLDRTLDAAGIPDKYARRIRSGGQSFTNDLQACLKGDPYLRILVDKQHALPTGYEPSDLVDIRNGSQLDMELRRVASVALDKMTAAARSEGVTLIVSSTYRSYQHQVETYERNVNEMGRRKADHVSARPGYSQHQLGLVVDFGSITNAFAETAAGRWILVNASRFGWSLSFPQGYEALTGYTWESWHYRYVGRNMTHFIDAWFAGIQQYALRFVYEWEQSRQKAISIDPDKADAYFNMGNVYSDQKNYSQAISAYQKAISIDPDYADAYYNMGVAYAEQGKYSAAITAFQQAISIKPDFAEAYYNMGFAYYGLGNETQLISCLQKAARLGDTDAQEQLKKNGYSW